MRPLTDDETRIFFEKLAKYIGRNIKHLLDRPDGAYCFRLHNDRVFYVSEVVMRAAMMVPRDDLVTFGVCLGKFGGKKRDSFRLRVTALDILAQHAKFKVWVKPSAEMSFLYGNHVPKTGLARITEGTPQYAGVVVYNMKDVPLGFGVAAQSTDRARDMDPSGNIVLHQADVGEYLREEAHLT